MSKVRIVTDSDASIPADILDKYSIEVVPQVLRVGRERYEDTDEFNADRLFQLIRENQSGGRILLPEVEAPDLSRLMEVYQRLGQDAEEIVAIHMSSTLSPMWSQSRKAADMMMGRYRIRVMDSQTTAMGLGMLAELAAEAAENGADLYEVARIVNGAIPHIYVTFFAETLYYLERSARLGAAQSVLGTMLGIKAMVTMEDGQLIPLEKVQTREDVAEKLYDYTAEFAQNERIGLVQHRYEQTQEQLRERLREGLPDISAKVWRYPPSLAAHLGPNVMGVIVYEGLG